MEKIIKAESAKGKNYIELFNKNIPIYQFI